MTYNKCRKQFCVLKVTSRLCHVPMSFKSYDGLKHCCIATLVSNNHYYDKYDFIGQANNNNRSKLYYQTFKQ